MYISDLSELQRVLHEMYEQLRDMRKENTYISYVSLLLIGKTTGLTQMFGH